ncbi:MULTISPECIES: ABC-F family ATP-binding cassette domain-containing protein [unclassified Oceanispirochaeta]|uniref:ABC-F family ATP-binding cassette domain-containing protein n=1 Tax=unclassified Oceanispirochaeta TaxID=2635722 RepID=UPI000E096FDB|nr:MULTISPECIES: ABC-F family ATP-binding cassette domain-containing protein [unclassified Oceanispirochaeta]MBF9016050.1 ABC-F family ATP-binding cassette domain-containing protein [Oceanispirochaeta sp. M2]NPD72513.1 ABC-F family ATP-binding cassette domain-containing protein [Oceanispirochaeta sp. M1]RDG31971.1 ABC transporter ATP-binding protein [Oceanispirochaeta sp. M1]
MNLISIDNITINRGGNNLVVGSSFGIDSDDKIALIGSNGCGKSSLISVLTGESAPDEGQVSRNKTIYISRVDQQPLFSDDEKVLDFIFRDPSTQMKLVKDYEICSKKMEENAQDETVLNDFHTLTEQMEKWNCWELESRIKSLLSELNIIDFNAAMSSLSGGMVKKAALVRALCQDYNLLILDEPTNHLDIPTIEWLQEYLKKSDKAFILVTHDRYFMENICNRILEIDDQSVFQYKGNYSRYLDQKALRQNIENSKQARIESILRNELKWISRGPRARAGKDKKRTANFYNLMDEKNREEASSAEFSSSFRRLGKKILHLKNIEFSYGDKNVIKPFSYQFRRGERIGLIGPNGSGKTTLLNLISGALNPDTGSIDMGINTHIGYFDQTGSVLKSDMKVMDYLNEHAEKITLADGSTLTPTQLLDRFLFPKSLYYTALGDVSGGERRRLYLIRILLSNPNFLLFDEPTNDLDLQTLSMLEDYLMDFPGCLMLVSHDRYFLDRVTDFQFVFDHVGNIHGYAGNYSEYKSLLTEKNIAEEAAAPAAKKETSQVVKRERKLSYKEKQEYEGIEEDILDIEGKIEEKEAAFSAPDFSPESAASLTVEYEALKKKLELKYVRWEELSALAGE